MVSDGIPLSTAVGLEPLTGDHDAFSRDRIEQVIQQVRTLVEKHRKVPLPDVAPGIVRELAGALRRPVADLAMEAWRKRGEILKYADPVRYPPDEAHEVWLKEHELGQSITATIEVRVEGVVVLSIRFPLTARLRLRGAKLVIRGGRITHFRLGDLTAGLDLAAEVGGLGRLELVEVQSKTWALPGEIALGEGIRLVAA